MTIAIDNNMELIKEYRKQNSTESSIQAEQNRRLQVALEKELLRVKANKEDGNSLLQLAVLANGIESIPQSNRGDNLEKILRIIDQVLYFADPLKLADIRIKNLSKSVQTEIDRLFPRKPG
jgi:hypothetical protein